MENNFRGRYRPASAESIVVANYIRYETLAEITNTAFAGSDANVLNVYIDLYQLFRKMYRSDVAIGNRSSVAAAVVNMCIHYRAFYKKYYGVHTRIYLMQTSGPMLMNEKFYPEYNHTNIEKMVLANMITTFMVQNCAILKELCKYLPDIYYIEGPYETSVMIYSTILDRKDNTPNIIISSSSLQYAVPVFAETQTIVVDHNWVDNGIRYRIVNKNNALIELLSKNKLVDNTIKKCVNINPQMFGLYMAMTRNEHRDLYAFNNVSSTLNTLNHAINRHEIPNSYISPEYTEMLSILVPPERVNELVGRYKAIDLVYQTELYRMSNNYLDRSWDVNLQDPDMVKLLNEKYFRDNPIDIDRI